MNSIADGAIVSPSNGLIQKALIMRKDGGLVGISAGYLVTTTETTKLAKYLNNPAVLAQKGITLEGVKYMVTVADNFHFEGFCRPSNLGISGVILDNVVIVGQFASPHTNAESGKYMSQACASLNF